MGTPSPGSPRYAEDLRGRRFAFFGELERWPSYLGPSAPVAVTRRGGVLHDVVDESVDYVVIGRGRAKGRAEAERKARKLADRGVSLLDEAGFLHLMRVDLSGARFAFAGGFVLLEGEPEKARELVAGFGGEVRGSLDEDTDYLVLGSRRAAGKAAAERKAAELRAAGRPLEVLSEEAFIELVRAQRPPGSSKGIAELLAQLHGVVDAGRLKRALDMLKGQVFNLYADVDSARMVGVVRSQTSSGVYSSALHADGRYACCSQSLEDCMGLQGQICKHLLVLVLGLVHAGEVEASTAEAWIRAAAKKRPAKDPQTLADTLLRYKSAEAGEIDWRPTETLPEDFYAY